YRRLLRRPGLGLRPDHAEWSRADPADPGHLDRLVLCRHPHRLRLDGPAFPDGRRASDRSQRVPERGGRMIWIFLVLLILLILLRSPIAVALGLPALVWLFLNDI